MKEILFLFGEAIGVENSFVAGNETEGFVYTSYMSI